MNIKLRNEDGTTREVTAEALEESIIAGSFVTEAECSVTETFRPRDYESKAYSLSTKISFAHVSTLLALAVDEEDRLRIRKSMAGAVRAQLMRTDVFLREIVREAAFRDGIKTAATDRSIRRQNEAYAEGSKAKAAGTPAEANPYKTDQERAGAWTNGWNGTAMHYSAKVV